MKSGPLHMFYVGRVGIGFWSTLRHMRRWRPRRELFWSGGLVYYSWLIFELHIDRRTDMLGDWMRGGPDA